MEKNIQKQNKFKLFANLIINSLKNNLKIIISIFLLFIVSFIVSYIFIYFNIFEFKTAGDFVLSQFKNKVGLENIGQISTIDIFIKIVTNNLFVALLSYVLNIFSLFVVLSNAFLMAYVLYTTNPFKFIVLIAPHGVIEIPALIISCSGGIVLLKSIYYFIKKDKNNYKLYLKDSFNLLIFSIFLFIIAGIIESTITFEIAKFIG